MTFSPFDLAVDRQLSELASSLPFLLLISPTNTPDCKPKFLADGDEPEFSYRQLPDLDRYTKTLDSIDPSTAEEPVLRHLFGLLHRELSLRIDMLNSRGSSAFLEGSIELFGRVQEPLRVTAERILGASLPGSPSDRTITGLELVARFQVELDSYGPMSSDFGAGVQLRDDIAGLVVENGRLMVGGDLVLTESHAEAVAHHEIGVHVLTHINGHAQPLQVLGSGLAHYDELQEALGLVAEYLAGGLRPSRLRVIAARVIAAAHLGEDESFSATFERLKDMGVSDGVAFTTTMRARRGGGITKDAIYLRGLMRLLDYLSAGNGIEPLFIGKMPLDDVPLINELHSRGLLIDPPLRPRVLSLPGAEERLDRLRLGISPIDLGGFHP